MIQTEIWKDIPGYEGLFQCSSMGRIKSLSRMVNCKYGNRKIKETIRVFSMWGHYFKIQLREHESSYLVHRLIAKTFIPNPDNKPFVNHINGIKTDNRVDNLEWCTRQENEDHAFSIGLKNSTGSNNIMSVLNEEQVLSIRAAHEVGYLQLAEMYGVSTATISRIIRRKTWTHI